MHASTTHPGTGSKLEGPAARAAALTLTLALAAGCAPGTVGGEQGAADRQATAAAAEPPRPLGFGVGGSLAGNWNTDGRAWAYNWGYMPKTEGLGNAEIFRPMVWGGPYCSKNHRFVRGSLGDVQRYRDRVCQRRENGEWIYDSRCTMDTRVVFRRPDTGVQTESITSYGRAHVFWTKDNAEPYRSWNPVSVKLTDVARYCGEKSAAGVCLGWDDDPTSHDAPCDGKQDLDCAFDTREFLIAAWQQDQAVESITAGSYYYNYVVGDSADKPESHGELTSIARYCGPKDGAGVCLGVCANEQCTARVAPCKGQRAGECRFDTRNVIDGKESITAANAYFNYDKKNETWATDKLTNVERYRFYGCYGQPSGTCRLDTRTFVTWGGQRVESVTAGAEPGVGQPLQGVYFNYQANTPGEYCAPDDPSLHAWRQSLQSKLARNPGPREKWLIYNEPDTVAQSNTQPEHAAKVYAEIVDYIKHPDRDPEATFYCCGTEPDMCGDGPACGHWMERFIAALPADPKYRVDEIHYHSYATGDDHQDFFGADAIIEGMKRFSGRMAAIPELAGRRILISEMAGLSRAPNDKCGPSADPLGESNRDIMRTIGPWIATTGRDAFGYDGAAWFMDYCAGGRFCSEGSVLYDKLADGSYALNCLGKTYFEEIVPLWR